MLVYRITQDEKEIKEYNKNQVYFDNKPIFNTLYTNSLYELNTFPNKLGVYKHFYYFPQDAFEIAKILLNLQKNNVITILEYELNNNSIINKIGFGNYNGLKRKDYLPKAKLIHISPYENSSYPVLEIRVNKDENIKISNSYYTIENQTEIPEPLNDLRKLKQFILYKTYLERILNDLNVNYPHGQDGLMRISKYNKNVKEISIPEKYKNFIY